MRLRRSDSNEPTVVTCGLCGWSSSASPEFADDLALALRSHLCSAKPPMVSIAGRATPVVRQLIIDSHGATFTTPRHRWDYRRPGAWLPLSMRPQPESAFEADVSRLWAVEPGPEGKTWRGWWGTLQRTDMTEAVTAMRETK